MRTIPQLSVTLYAGIPRVCVSKRPRRDGQGRFERFGESELDVSISSSKNVEIKFPAADEHSSTLLVLNSDVNKENFLDSR